MAGVANDGAARIASRARLAAAVSAGKLTGSIARFVGRGGGTSAPGMVARTIDAGVLRKVVGASAARKVLVTGSNGKTTTCRMVSALVEADGRRVIQNRTGSNLVQGVTSVAVRGADVLGRLNTDVLVFEIDEATVRTVAPEIEPDVTLVTNIFRDQLDRFGEIYSVAGALETMAAELPATATLVVNGDDPMVAAFAARAAARTLAFGIETDEVGFDVPEHAADTVRCVRCQHNLVYTRAYLSHLGAYHCPSCGLSRPPLDIAVTSVTTTPGGVDIQLRTPTGQVDVSLALTGVHNVYNAAAAIATGVALQLDLHNAARALSALRPAFGRLEEIRAGDRTIVLAFVKNPISYNATLRAIAQSDVEKHVLAVHSNTTVDGEDFSWLWDVELEAIAPQIRWVLASGTKSAEVAMRYKYAGLTEEQIETVPDVRSALDRALARVEPGGTLHVLAGYTPMRELRRIMQQRKWVRAFWEE